MSKSKTNFSFFPSFIVRTPRYPLNFYENLIKSKIGTEEMKNILKDRDILEAIFLASPELYAEIQKLLKKEIWNNKKADKIKDSVLKYLIRMSTRCTPFGLFSSCGMGKFEAKSKIQTTNISTDKINGFYRKTRLDMQFLGALGHEYINRSTLHNELLLYPNTTLYQLVGYYRYIQYSLDKGKRFYSLEGFKRTKFLDLILEKARTGIKKYNLTDILVSKKVDENEAIEFIDELIEQQILVYETEANLTGEEYIDRLMNLIGSLKKVENLSTQKSVNTNQFPNEEMEDPILLLEKFSKTLIEIDSLDSDKNPFDLYQQTADVISGKGIVFDQKYLFQTDLFLKNCNLNLNEEYVQDITKAISFLHKISEKPKNSSLENFKKAFIDRYEEQKVPLVKALDVERGLGYVQHNNFDVTPLLDAIGIRQVSNGDLNIQLNKADQIILGKLQSFDTESKNSVTLKASDFENIDFSNENLPITFSCIFEIVEVDDKQWVSIQSIGGSSAANLLARFCYGHKEINRLANEITKYELDHLSDKIIAEIVHLPENRTGNVLRRPNFRPYEIPYLGQSGLPASQQININDILLFIENGRLKMWSIKNDKEIITRLTNAHNYSFNSLPIYHFLCDMQFENCKSSIGINHNKMDKILDYFPRIIIDNCIISKQRWIFTREKQQALFKKFKDCNVVYNREIFNLKFFFPSSTPPLPQYVSLVDHDNTLLINLESKISIEILIRSVKDRSHFVLEEYLFPSKEVINDVDQNYYANQFIIGLKWKSE